MVLIRKDDAELTVTKGAYKALFSKQGWRLSDEDKIDDLSPENNGGEEIVDDGDKDGDTEKSDGENDEDNSEEESEDDSEMPISEMNTNQLKEYAEKHNIDLEGATRRNDILRIITEELED